MHIITLSETETQLLSGVLADLAADESKGEYYIGNRDHPRWERKTFLSDVQINRLQKIERALRGE